MARLQGPGVLRAALIVLGFFLLGAAWLSSLFPKAQADRLEPAPGVTGVGAGQSLAWILRTKNGAALIDAGMDRDARALLAELRAQGLDASKVHSILLTHAHPDHWGGAAAFPEAKVYAGAGELPYLEGKKRFTSFASHFFGLAGGMPQPLAAVTAVSDGQVLDLDGEEVRAIALPGHTPGSTAYLWKDLLFSGDALLGDGADAVTAAPWVFSENTGQAKRSLEKLRDLPFTRMADGHVGATADARMRLLRLLRR